ncbi:basement membrane-specific heparan sulfate proteoglycan core protein isoform X3 [Neoarius graeffei]|uniref:basement membrane-specific heparan sulfate proteoglycan core protein isoform X3 n=1 Tax=Neoarius graeffei TaxID=443677 RepID=UPI00298C6F6C|nr:basement membrane-specific heparan sulfate proteoglycan core protein isoform X3 [Neoarius graeffei]
MSEARRVSPAPPAVTPALCGSGGLFRPFSDPGPPGNMGTRKTGGVRKLSVFLLMVFGSHLMNVAESSKVWDEVPFPEDLEVASGPKPQHYLDDDDEDFAADEASGDLISGEEDGSTPEPPVVITIYYRALVNFTGSFSYGPELDDINSEAFQEISSAVIDTLESEYFRIPGTQTVNVVLIKQIGKDVFVELDVGSEDNSNEAEIRAVLYSVVSNGSIASYVTSVRGFEFRRLGELKTGPPVPCVITEFTCRSGECIPLNFVCDNKPDCPDMSDESICAPKEPTALPPIQIPSTTSEVKITQGLGPCRADQSTCQNGQCISRDYVCDGERDCSDGSDELNCGTPSPCEPNEFKCRNGRCALKLWRCDGDNDCHDNSDELDCPTKKPGDVCAPEHFTCLSDQTCIPASYQCDEEPDCSDRSDEYGCAAPVVTSPPEESITAVRGQTVTFTCMAVGVPIPIITWRLNWGHIPPSNRITVTNENGRGTLTIRDVKEGDQGAYTCEAINAKGLVFAIPDGVLTLTRVPSNCPEGHFNIGSHCMPCFCFGITSSCHSTRRYRAHIALRFTEEDDFKGVNVSFPSRPGTPPPLSSTQMMVNPEVEEFQLVDLSRRFLDLESYWTLPRQFLGSKVDSYGGSLKYKVSYLLQRDGSEPVDKPDVVLRGNGNRLVSRLDTRTKSNVKNEREVKFTEEHWQHSSGQPVSRADLLMTLANLESISIRTIYDNRMASVGLSDIIMDTTSTVFSFDGQPKNVEECRCPLGYSGLSCESCSHGFERIPGDPYLGTCAGCNCHGHASACDPISGHCLSCQHNTEGPQCDKCRPGYFGDPSRGRPDDCKPCPCPYTETSRRFSDTCFLDVDRQATCDACAPGYTGRRCEKCAPGYIGNPLQPNGNCIPYSQELTQCDNRGTISSSSRPCNCKANVAGTLCDECKPGSFHLSAGNPEGCLQCFCMGVTKQCASSTWTRDQVRGGVNGQLFSLTNEGNTRFIVDGITQRGSAEVFYRSFTSIPNDIYYWVLPESFQGDKVTAYGGELRYKVRYEPGARSVVIENKPDVVLQGNNIFLEHYSQTKTLPRVPATFVVPFRESAWRRADGQPCTREHLLMALADLSVFMIRATYADSMAESSVADIQMDIAVPHFTGNERALEVEECACPQGYRGPSCQDCDLGYTRIGSGVYLGTCEKCECHGHASSCDSETGACLQCQHHTVGSRCENCLAGFYGDPVTGGVHACRPCPCFGPTSGSSETKSCYLDSDGQPTCNNCPVGYTGRRCEGCAPGYTGNPEHGQSCTPGRVSCQNCDQRGSEDCISNRICRCKMNVEGPSCSSCKPGTFHLSLANKDGCLACFCMGITQQCSSSSLYRDVITTVFAPGNTQGFALVNRQRTNRVSDGFSVEMSTDRTQLSFTNFDHHSQELHFWQLPSSYQGDKKQTPFKRLKRSHKSSSKLDDEIWELISNFSKGPPASLFSSSSSSASSFPVRTSGSAGRSGGHARVPPLPPSALQASVWASGPHPGAPGRSPYLTTVKDKLRKNTVEPSSAALPGSSSKYSLVYNGFSLHSDDVLFWKLPEKFRGDKVQAYGGKLKYTISYVPGPRGAPIEDVDVQIIGNDITLLARQDWRRGLATRETRNFEFIFREEYWQRPDGMPATREHLLMVLADLDDILIRASYHTVMRSSSISGVSMEIAVPHYTGQERALEVEQCRCPPGYQGLSCQDCAPGYTRTGGGLYLGHCELCECNGHSDSCHPETGVCTNCQHNTMGELCDQCAAGFFGDASAGTPEDCQPCACPHTDPENQFSPTCESLGNGDYQCTACQPGYTGQYCDRCAPGYVGNPQQRIKCRPYDAAAPLTVRVYPERVQVSQGSPVTLRCQGSGPPPHYFYWTRDDGRPISSSAERRRQGEELHFSRVQPSDTGVYTCTCRNQLSTNRSRAEIIVTTSPSKPIEVFIEEPKSQRVVPGATVNFICTAKSKFPAYTLVWTRQGSGKLPDRAMDFNGILTIHNVRPEDAGVYVCTGSNMFAMDEGTAVLYVPDGTKAEMFYTAYEMFEGHRQPGEITRPTVTIHPAVIAIPQGQRAEFRCTATGNPAPSVEWTGGPGNRISSRAIIRGGVLTFPSVQRSDEGDYICRALTTHGEHTARAVLYIYGSPAGEVVKPTVTIHPSVLRVQQGTRVEFHCTATGNPTPSVEWTGGPGNRISGSAIIRGGVLIFPSVEPSDEGDYTCRALNTHGEHAARAVLYVQRSSVEVTKPTVKIQSPVLTVQQGQRAELRCSVTGDPAPSIEWTGGPGNRISSRAIIQDGVLIFPSVERSDEGEYICRAFNTHGEHAARLVLYVQSSSAVVTTKPTVTIHPPVITIQRGQHAEFRCTATGNPTPSVEWTGGPGNRISSSAVIRGGVLTFPSVQRSDEGDYTCRAVNTHGEHTARAVLYVHSASLPHVQVSPQRVEIHEGETLRLYCRAGGSPSPGLTWKKRGGTLPPQAIPSHGFHQFKSNSLDALQRRIDEMQARTERTDYGTLLIPDMKISDAGTYLCIGTNAIGSSEAVIEVTVIKGETVPSDVTIQSTSSTVVQGETLELNCVVQGSPPPSVIWSRASGLGLSSNHQVIGSKLRILQASPDDSGEYICRVYGGPNTRQATVYVSVTSEAVRHQSPIISIEPHSIIVKKGESASFRCRLHTGAQPVRLEWKLSTNEPLQDNVEISPDGSMLTISSAQPANQGAYRCVASNPYGVTHSIASLIVREPPRATVTPTGPVRVKAGEPINLECQASGEPRASVTWHRLDNNRKMILSSPVPMESNAVMQILVARPEDSGTYVCTVQNSQGRSETRVEVIIEGGTQVPTVPRAIVREPFLVVVEGATTVLHCDAHGFPKPTITWSKLRAPLPWRHKIVNNSLVLPNVGRQDSGQYICNATNHMGTSEVTIMVDVETPPYTTTLPDDVAVRVGEVIRLQCLAHGTPPMRFEWSKVDGRLPARAEVHGGDLQINLASPSDAGTYKCVASNKVGRSEAVAKVSVRSPLSVRVSPQVEVKALGSAVEFTCSASGGPDIVLEWLKEGGTLPHNHHIKDGVLRIENLEKSNEGMYICRATTLFGQAQDTAKLTIQALPKVMINVRTSVQTVTVGTSVEFECHAEGDPVPTLHWSKVGAPLPDHVQVKGAMLRIDRVTEADAGQYRCTATNNVGSVQSQVVLNIQSLPQIAAQPDTKEVTVGSTAIFPCIATGYPVPNITWSKLENELPPKCVQEAHVLTVPDVNHEDSGTYVCTASNKQGKVQAFTKLNVHERVMPYFSQEPLSYLKLPTIKNSYKAFKIKITFRPDNVDGLILYSGMILYNGQKKTMGADFISLGLVGGRPEFRFDVGSGMATIRYPTAIKLGEFHTVQLYRNGTQGSIIVDDEAPINGTSQGKFQGLDLNEELFVGGYPNYSMIAKTAELKSGFVGCISQLIIQGDEVIFKDLDRSSTGVTNCPTCKDHPCQNGGVCQDSVASLYKCSCLRGFTGSNCQHLLSEHCHPEACGPDATCINRPSGAGYDCRCHLGKYGHKCMDGTLVTTPLFNSDESYISYPPLTNIHNDLRIDMEFKPLDEDGLMFFIGGKKMKVEDFVTLSLVDGHVEFRYELGTGQAVLHSHEQVSVGQWHHVTAERFNQDGFLKLDDGPEVRRSSPGKAQGLNVYTAMFLGGVPTKDILPKSANSSMFFEGCIGEVSINGKKIDLSYTFIESRAISQCVDVSPCDRRPCQHGGTCMPSAEYEFQCFCRDGYEGDRCEVVKDTCLDSSQCHNGGSCVDGHCVCAVGYTGVFCTQGQEAIVPEAPWNLEGSRVNDSPQQYAAYFHDDGYLSLSKSMFPRSTPESPETIELEINTVSADGLVLWQGVEPAQVLSLHKSFAHNKASALRKQTHKQESGAQGKGKDFISLGLQNGHLVFSYQLGSGEAEIVSKERINDGHWHKITAVRTGKQGYIQVDDRTAQHGQSPGRSVMVNTKGNIYLGGAPDLAVLTGGKFSSGITGCVKNLSLLNARPGEQPSRSIDLQLHGNDGKNVRRCTS